jgi:ABC-type Fe3+ transport system substrate-binding protein
MLESETTIEPGIVGVVRPVLLLPKGIRDRLTPQQLRAVLAHEHVHLERRDNLTASLHMIVEAIFWFHPLVWWIGARLITERERACDEAAVKRLESREGYADGILGVCKFYVAPPLRSTSAVSGGDLRRRIETILLGSDPEELSMSKKTLLTAFLVAVVLGPVLLGAFQPLEAQTTSSGGSASEWRNSPYVRSLYEQARAEGEVRILGFDRRGLNWMQQAIAEEFPGIRVTVAPVLEHLSVINGQVAEGRPLPYDVAQTSLMEAQVFSDLGLLAPMDWSAFGVSSDRVVPGGWFAYTNNFVFTIAYDRNRVGERISLAPRGSPLNRPIPSTWRELLQPEFKGLLATNPAMIVRLVAGLGVAWGPYEAEAYARELVATQQTLVRFGDAALIMLDDDMNYPNYVGMAHTATELWVRAGLPVRYVVPEPVIMEQQGPAVFATAPHPAAAKLIAGYLASPEGIAARQKHSYSVDLRPESRDPMAVALREQADDIVYDSPATARDRARSFGAAHSILRTGPVADR